MSAEPINTSALRSLDKLSPMALADLMLLEVLARGHGTLVLEPHGPDHRLVFDGGDVTMPLTHISRELAEATLARLALVASIGLEPPKIGRIRMRLASHQGAADARTADILLSLRSTAIGVSAELHALAGGPRPGELAAVAGIEGVPAPPMSAVKYQVQRELGRGGMGIVYLARHVQLDKEVALKVLAPAMAQRSALAAQFVVEARAACRARHNAIVDVTDFGHLADGRNYLVMEYIDWPTLAQRLAEERLAPRQALRIALEMARGLAAAHAQGVIHRDLKPANVFVSSDNRVKIGDFGLAHAAGSGEQPPLGGLYFGTVPYMAPEQRSGASADPRTDLYAFGCILCELLTGSTPYAGDSEEVLEMHEKAPIPPLLVDGKPACDGLGALHKRLLAKDPAQRPGSFETVIAEIEACAKDLL